MSTVSAASIKPGSSCPKLGSTKVLKGLKYTCIKSGKKSVWSKGVEIKKVEAANPATGTPTPNPEPTPSDAIAIRVNALINTGTGTSGIFLKEANGPTLSDFRGATPFEPASSIKALIALYAFERKAAGAVTMQTQIPKVTTSNPKGCPVAETAGTETLETAIRQMMRVSDNDRTLSLMLYFGVSQLNAYAKTLGLTKTSFNTISSSPGFTILGCVIKPIPADPKTVDGHFSTLADLTKVWEQANDLPAEDRQLFMSLTAGREMVDSEGYDFTGVTEALNKIAREEAPAILSSTALNKFLNNLRSNQKGGSYTVCYKTANCTTVRFWLSMVGLTTLPVCQSGTITSKRFVWGYYLSDADSNDTAIDTSNPATKGFVGARGEILREQIRASLANWSQCS